MTLSYADGASATPLLGRDDRRQPRRAPSRASRRARRSSRCHQGRALHLRRARRARSTALRARAARRRARAGRPRRHLEPELRRVGARPVRHRQASGSSSSTSTRPTGPPSSSTRCASPAAACWSPRRRSRPPTTWRWSTRCARQLPELERVGLPRHAATGTSCSPAASASPRTSCARAPADARSSTTRSTSSTRAARPASPRARRSATTTSSTTATSSARAAGYTERGPGLHPGALLPLLRHGAWATSAAPRTAPAWSSPAPAFEPAATLRGGRRTSAARRSTACRRCSSPSSSTRASTTFDLSQPAHRDHGRLAVPGRGDEAGHRPRCTWTR